jgi:hypothetical protein
LPTRTDYHPKRNEARKRLATISNSFFELLGGDVYDQLDRRYPELSELEEVSSSGLSSAQLQTTDVRL